MIYVAVVSIGAIAGLIYLLLKSYEQNAQLLDRIQAPERVIEERLPIPSVPSIGFDSDEEFWKTREDTHA